MNQTEDIKDLVAALSKAQGAMEPARFNRVNPHFKNRYADFTSCMDACREPLVSNGLSVMQYCENVGEKLTLVTMLAHTSGQWIKSSFPLNPAKMDSQGIGSAMTYAKRYSLSAMLGIVSDDEIDDDGEASQGRGSGSITTAANKVSSINASQKAKVVVTAQQLTELREMEMKLDEATLSRFYSWMKTAYGVSNFDALDTTTYPIISKYLEQAGRAIKTEKKEEVVNA